MLERVGKKFDAGWPYINSNGGLHYEFPNKKFQELFDNSIRDLGDYLLTKFKSYLVKFGVKQKYPTVMRYEAALGFPFGDREDIELSSKGNNFIYFHNPPKLSKEIFVGFNMGSDAIEFLDKEFLAPRIVVENGDYVIKYPLLNGTKLLPVDSNEWFFKREGLERIFEFEKLGKIKRDYQKDKQIICCEKGRIKIEGGVCEGEDFERWDICKVTFPIAKLFDASYLR